MNKKKNVTFLRLVRIQMFGTQEQAANILHMSRPYYALVEGGRLKPTEKTICRIETVFGECWENGVCRWYFKHNSKES